MKDAQPQRRWILLKAVLFVAIFLVVSAGLSRLYFHVVVSFTTLYQTDCQFREHFEETEVLCLGDSHAGTSVNWMHWPNIFVFWSAGETYAHHYYKLRAVLADPACRVRCVIAPIDPHSLTWRFAGEFREPSYWVQYLDFIELGWRRGELLFFAKEYLRGRFFAYAGELEAADEYLQSALSHREMGPLRTEAYVGYGLRPLSEWWLKPNRGELASNVARAHFSEKTLMADFQVQYFLDLLDLCAAHDLPVLLVKYPLSHEYQAAIAEYMDQADFYRRVEELIAPFPNVFIFDGQDVYADLPSAFNDPDHIEGRAAWDFAERLKQRLVKMELLDPVLLKEDLDALSELPR